MGRDWEGIRKGLGRDWEGIEKGLGRDWEGIGKGLERDWEVENGEYVKGIGWQGGRVFIGIGE